VSVMNDPVTEFWVSQDGARVDDTTRGNLEMREHTHESGGEPERSWADDDIHQAVTAAADEVKNRSSDREDWDGSREHREALSEAYPQGDLNNYVLNKLGWHRAFQENPVAAREQYVRAWSRQTPFHPKITPKVKEEPPADWLESGKAEWQADKDARDGYREAARNRADAEAFVSSAKLRQLVKERTGLSFSDFLTKCRQIDAASLDDPAGIANRFAVFSGMPSTQAEAEELQAAQQQQHAIAEQRQAAAVDLSTQMGIDALPPEVQTRMADFIEYARRRGIAQNVEEWPTLVRHAYDAARNELAAEAAVREVSAKSTIEQFTTDPANKHYAKLENEVANILMSGRIQRTGDMRADLKTAYDMACRTSPEVAAERARRASRSVTGGPAPGARSAATQHSRGGYDDDLHADVRAAVRAGLI
jgi:hypothetical protein